MKNYLNNILDTSEEDREHKLSFNNTISLDTLSNTEKNLKKYSYTPKKTKLNKSYLILTRNTLNKEILSDINSTGNNSDRNIKKVNLNESKKNLTNNEQEQNIHIDIKEIEHNLDDHKVENSQNIRRDVYGKEIKKGGNHRITFADNVQMIKARMKLEEEVNLQKGQYINNESDFNSDNKIRRVRSLKRSLIDLKELKLQKKSNIENSDRKIFNLVEVIEIQNYKELNKNEFLYPQDVKNEEENIENQEPICCSGICCIY